jgi:hypothetical protein
MTFTDHGDSVTLQMNRDQFLYLSWLLEIASTAMGQTGCDDMVYGALKFVNELNRTNPNFTRYELPRNRQRHSMSKLSGQASLFTTPVMTVREFVRERLAGLEWRQRARVARRAKRAKKQRGLVRAEEQVHE